MTRLAWPDGCYGRDGELAFVSRASSAARSARSPRIVVVSGEAGVGKSTFLDAVAVRSRRSGYFVLHGRHERAAPGTPFVSVQQALHSTLARHTPRGRVAQEQASITLGYLSAHAAQLEYFIDLPAIRECVTRSGTTDKISQGQERQ